jgi:hypothetical protein
MGDPRSQLNWATGLTQLGQQGGEFAGQYAALQKQEEEKKLNLKRQLGAQTKQQAANEQERLTRAIQQAQRLGNTQLGQQLQFRLSQLDEVLKAPDDVAVDLWEQFSKPQPSPVAFGDPKQPALGNPMGTQQGVALGQPFTLELGSPVNLNQFLTMTPLQRVAAAEAEASRLTGLAEDGTNLASFLDSRVRGMPDGPTKRNIESQLARWIGGERSEELLGQLRESVKLITSNNSQNYMDAVSRATELLSSPLLTEAQRQEIRNKLNTLNEASTLKDINDFNLFLADMRRTAGDVNSLQERAKEIEQQILRYVNLEETDNDAVNALRTFYAERWPSDIISLPPEQLRSLVEEGSRLLRSVPQSLAITARTKATEEKVTNFLLEFGKDLEDADRERLSMMVADGRYIDAIREAVGLIRNRGTLDNQFNNLLKLVEPYNDYIIANKEIATTLNRIKQDYLTGDVVKKEQALKELTILVQGEKFKSEIVGKVAEDAGISIRARRYEIQGALSKNLAEAVAKGEKTFREEIERQYANGLITPQERQAYLSRYLEEAKLNDKYNKAEREGRYREIVYTAIENGDIYTFNRYYGLAGIGEEEKVKLRDELEKNQQIRNQKRLLEIRKLELDLARTTAGINLLPATIAAEKAQIAEQLGKANVPLTGDLAKDPVIKEAWERARKQQEFDDLTDRWRFQTEKERQAWQEFSGMVANIPSNKQQQQIYQRELEKKLIEAGYSAQSAGIMASSAIEMFNRNLSNNEIQLELRRQSLELSAERLRLANERDQSTLANRQSTNLGRQAQQVRARIDAIESEINALFRQQSTYKPMISGTSVVWQTRDGKILDKAPPEVLEIDERIKALLGQKEGLTGQLTKYEAAMSLINQYQAPLNPADFERLGIDPASILGTPLPTSNSPTGQNFTQKYGPQVQTIAQRLGVDPNHLMAVISFETGGTFNPASKNPYSTAIGLFQMTDKAARDMGYNSAAEWYRANPTPEKQLEQLEQYLRMKGVKPGSSLSDIYVAVTGGARPGAPDSTVIYSRERTPVEYAQNNIWDVNKDGIITKGELAQVLQPHLRNYFSTPAPSQPAPAQPAQPAPSQPAQPAPSQPSSTRPAAPQPSSGQTAQNAQQSAPAKKAPTATGGKTQQTPVLQAQIVPPVPQATQRSPLAVQLLSGQAPTMATPNSSGQAPTMTVPTSGRRPSAIPRETTAESSTKQVAKTETRVKAQLPDEKAFYGYDRVSNLLENPKNTTEKTIRGILIEQMKRVVDEKTAAQEAQQLFITLMRIYGLNKDELAELIRKYAN